MSPIDHTTCWTLDKKISVAFLFVLALQIFGSVWWASDLSARVNAVEKKQLRYERMSEDLAEIKTDVKWIKGAIK